MNNLRIIFTEADKRLAKKYIPNYRGSYVIDLSEYILEAEYIRAGFVSSPKEYIANGEITKKLKQSVENRKSAQIVYYHFDINETMVENVKQFYALLGAKIELAVFDPVYRHTEMYHLFDTILPYADK